MFFIMNALWIGCLIVSGISFYNGNKMMGLVFFILAVLDVIFMVLIYGKSKWRSNSNLDCILLDCGLDALPDCLHHADCDCTP